MTIIKPRSYRTYLSFILWFFVLILVGGSFYIFEYNDFVGNRESLKRIKNSIAELQVENAEFRNKFYEIVDGPRLEHFAKERGLVLDKKPDYLSTNRWLSDSSH